MQKYKIWIIVALVILCLVTLLLWLSPQDEKQTSNEPDSAQPAILDREANALNVSAQNNTFLPVPASRIPKSTVRCSWIAVIA